MIQITNLSVDFGGVRAVNEVTVNMDQQIVGVIGPNGAGKTTVLNVLSGFVKPTSGSALAFGQDLLSMSAHQRARWGLRRTFQTEQVVEDLSVWDNVAVMLDPVWQGRAERRAQVQAAIDFVGLTGSEARLGQNLNAYERRLVEIGRAIVGRPRIVLMDEPGAGLSETERDQLQRLIKGIPERFGAIVVLIDHDVNLIAATCHSTAVLDFGSLIAYGPTRTVLQDDKVKAAYLGVEASHGP
jgi:ABC-type branched-subunit amino acid transport system ATPase component